VLYSMLFMVWVYALNSKIQHGPDPDDLAPKSTSAEQLLDAASGLVQPSPFSLTEAKPLDDGDPPEQPR
jgi:hypothetical protein